MFGQPLQFVRDKTLTAFDASRLNLHGQASPACRHLLSNRFIGSCIEFGERCVECHLKGKRCTQGRHVRSTFIARDLISVFTAKQIGNLALAEPGSFSISSQIIRKFVRRHVASDGALRP